MTTYTLLDDIIPALLELYDVATAAAHDVVIVAARCCRLWRSCFLPAGVVVNVCPSVVLSCCGRDLARNALWFGGQKNGSCPCLSSLL